MKIICHRGNLNGSESWLENNPEQIETGKVLIHIDHWDSLTQLITKIPVVGNIVKLILKFFNI